MLSVAFSESLPSCFSSHGVLLPSMGVTPLPGIPAALFVSGVFIAVAVGAGSDEEKAEVTEAAGVVATAAALTGPLVFAGEATKLPLVGDAIDDDLLERRSGDVTDGETPRRAGSDSWSSRDENKSSPPMLWWNSNDDVGIGT